MGQPWALHTSEHTSVKAEMQTEFWWGNLKKSHWGPRCRWEDDIKTDIKDMECTILVQDREQCRAVVNTITNLPDTQNAGNFRVIMPILGPSQQRSKTIQVVGDVTLRPWRLENTSCLHIRVLRGQTQISFVYQASCPSADGYLAIQ